MKTENQDPGAFLCHMYEASLILKELSSIPFEEFQKIVFMYLPQNGLSKFWVKPQKICKTWDLQTVIRKCLGEK